MIKGNLQHLITTGNIDGRRSGGRKTNKTYDDIIMLVGRNKVMCIMFVATRYDEKWNIMIM